METVREFYNQAEANLIASVLRDLGFHVFLADQNSFAYGEAGFSISLRLQVPAEEAEAARELLWKMDSAAQSQQSS